jgi:hypothetical protein
VAVETLCLLHDIGYAAVVKLDPDQRTEKFLHAPLGARLIQHAGPKGDNLFALLAKILNATKPELLTTGMIEAIERHNYDTHATKPAVVIKTESVVAQGLAVRNIITKGESISREFTAADSRTKPMLFVVRFADNLDSRKARLIPLQQNEWFIQYLQALSWTKDTRKGNRDPLTLWNAIQGTPALTVVEKAQYESKKVTDALKLDVETLRMPEDKRDRQISHVGDVTLRFHCGDFVHFISNWIIETIKVEAVGTGLVVKVKMNDYTSFDAQYPVPRGPKEYQIIRAQEALNSLSVNGVTADQALTVQIDYPGQPGTPKQLSAFARTAYESDNLPFYECTPEGAPATPVQGKK